MYAEVVLIVTGPGAVPQAQDLAEELANIIEEWQDLGYSVDSVPEVRMVETFEEDFFDGDEEE